MKAHTITGGLLLIALCLALAVGPTDPDALLAEQILGPVERHFIGGFPMFFSDRGDALFFTSDGMEGLIRGVILVEGDVVRQVQILRSRDGIDHRALERGPFLQAFAGKSIETPIAVDAVSGATITSQRVLDAVNECVRALKVWRRENRVQ